MMNLKVYEPKHEFEPGKSLWPFLGPFQGLSDLQLDSN